ncbi:hypothetical protein ASG11_01060 [Sphingomonas sp. Leaf357]|uniref:hypothetical protein n=1 Tax=Sphingomonas sp. Leaf357 TaxID=1736350 RepID=UPI0006FE3C79|nr:hypothetical protein [Sphingomonas sp. Leaf357]KQS03023.1 hypothetical protein ASG11_01060 [Sphingomonas sp. Leaf357]
MVRMLLGLAVAMAVSGPVGAQTEVVTRATAKVKTDDSSTMVCKREVDTGSLVAKRKICKTKADWDREMLRARDSMRPTQSCRGSQAGTFC